MKPAPGPGLIADQPSSEAAVTMPVWERRESPGVPPRHRVVDLFCGAGGLAEGFRLAGFESVLGVDAWEPACSTFAENQPTANVLLSDITKITADDFLSYSGLQPGELGVLCGGPPCQGFSVAGKRMSDDPRNFLYKHFLRAVEVLQPAWVVMENVPALLHHPEVAPAIQRDFADLKVSKGYELTYGLVMAANYGVPQTRTRVMFVARRKDVPDTEPLSLSEMMAPTFAESEDLFGSPTFLTVNEAIDDLPHIKAAGGAEVMDYDEPPHTAYQRLMRGEIQLPEFFESKGLPAPGSWSVIPHSPNVFNHVAQKHSALLVERFDNIPAGGSKEDLRLTRPDLLPPEGHPEQGLTYGRLWPDRPSGAIPANYSRPSGNRSIHPSQPRLITPREAMRLSSFRDSYRLSGLMVAQREQVGNAVPPLMAYHIAREIQQRLGKIKPTLSAAS